MLIARCQSAPGTPDISRPRNSATTRTWVSLMGFTSTALTTGMALQYSKHPSDLNRLPVFTVEARHAACRNTLNRLNTSQVVEIRGFRMRDLVVRSAAPYCQRPAKTTLER